MKNEKGAGEFGGESRANPTQGSPEDHGSSLTSSRKPSLASQGRLTSAAPPGSLEQIQSESDAPGPGHYAGCSSSTEQARDPSPGAHTPPRLVPTLAQPPNYCLYLLSPAFWTNNRFGFSRSALWCSLSLPPAPAPKCLSVCLCMCVSLSLYLCLCLSVSLCL